MSPEQSARRCRADNRGELILIRKRCHHFAGTRRVLVKKEYNSAMEALFSEAFRRDDDRLVPAHKFQCQPDKANFLRRDVIEDRQLLLGKPPLGPSAGDAVTDGNPSFG